jgi:hypothetical protein
LARHEQIRLVDDLDGSSAATTVTFGLDGQTYELDLTDGHANELRTLFAPYVKAGRWSGTEGRRPSRRSSARATRTSSPNNAAIRTWAQQQGLAVSSRGRIPDHVRRAYAERDATPRLAPGPQQPKPLSGHQARILPPVTDPFTVTAAS